MSEMTRDENLNVQKLVNQTKELNHGDTVVGEDGVAGIVIEDNHEAKELMKATSVSNITNYLKEQDNVINSIKNGEPVEMSTSVDSEEAKQVAQNNEAAKKVMEASLF